MNTIEIAEEVLLNKFKIEPFHNFHRLKETSAFRLCKGGTCSDKTKSYIEALNKKGIKAHLHTAKIDKKYNHQLARIEFDGNTYFADVGNGWPSIYLYSGHKEVDYTCFGMRFRSEINNDSIKIFHSRNKKERLQMEFNRTAQDQLKVENNINNRFAKSIKYPFDNGLRFSMVVDDKFLFIRNNELQFYSDKGCSIIDGVSPNNLSEVIKKHFHFDINK